MSIPFATPAIEATDRAVEAAKCRKEARMIASARPHAITANNGEEYDYAPQFTTNFTKGLAHDRNGILQVEDDYLAFVEAINSDKPTLFESDVIGYADRQADGSAEVGNFACKTLSKDFKTSAAVNWRGWESPRSGHVYDLQGPDAGAVGMAPAPRVGSSELAFEMAEVYTMALLRDVPFEVICEGGDLTLCEERKESIISAKDAADFLNSMDFLNQPTSSTPGQVGRSGLNAFEEGRRDARLIASSQITPETLFRGSTAGAMVGPYISQFLLIGNDSRNCQTTNGRPNFPATESNWDFRDGFINYGTQPIDQRHVVAKPCLDYMTDWTSWLDVQNGANLSRLDIFEKERRFITTPRDLATYVHFDALYQAYLNAALIMLGLEIPNSKGFPELSGGKGRNLPNPQRRTPFATYGGPHILSLVTEVATRCLKAVRRQKFNYHRRARPEVMGGRLTLLCGGDADALGNAKEGFGRLFKEVEPLQKLIEEHNRYQNSDEVNECRRLGCEPLGDTPDERCNMLLPMAFPEGSPMHPAYGAGHATVAGGCVTVLKAFFEMYEDSNCTVERILCHPDGTPIAYESDYTERGRKLKKAKLGGNLTVQGELDKLVGNISIGRNMAGVHYYSDYYDSIRMGERIAVGILQEQAITYGERTEMTFKSFDDDLVTIRGSSGKGTSTRITNRNGSSITEAEWLLRYVVGEEMINRSLLPT